MQIILLYPIKILWVQDAGNKVASTTLYWCGLHPLLSFFTFSHGNCSAETHRVLIAPFPCPGFSWSHFFSVLVCYHRASSCLPCTRKDCRWTHSYQSGLEVLRIVIARLVLYLAVDLHNGGLTAQTGMCRRWSTGSSRPQNKVRSSVATFSRR